MIDNHRHLTITALFFLLIIGLLSCHEDKPTPENMNQAFKQYFDYQPNSYWVFHDSLNNHTDSLVVIQYIDRPPFYNSSDAYESMIIQINLYDIDSLADSSTWNLCLNAPYYSHIIAGSSLVPATEYIFVYNMPFDNDTNIYQIPNYTIGTLSYNNVSRVRVASPNDFFFINSDDGFIEILLNDTYWHKELYLLRYNILH